MKIHLRIMVDLLEASNNLRAPTVRCFVGYGYIGCVYISIGGKLTTSIAIIPQLLFLHTSCSPTSSIELKRHCVTFCLTKKYVAM